MLGNTLYVDNVAPAHPAQSDLSYTVCLSVKHTDVSTDSVVLGSGSTLYTERLDIYGLYFSGKCI